MRFASVHQQMRTPKNKYPNYRYNALAYRADRDHLNYDRYTDEHFEDLICDIDWIDRLRDWVEKGGTYR